jgi:hypothetical protein
MALEQQVKTYLAYWFQLGKKLLSSNNNEQLLPQTLMNGDHFSPEFEKCWQKIIAKGGKNYYLEGTKTTIEELLSPAWDITPCARCEMPVPMLDLGNQSLDCPCNDLDNWPNLDLPQPRSSVNSIVHLENIKSRLNTKQ